MTCFWVYMWCYAPPHGPNNPDCQVRAASSGDAVVAAMQWLRLPYVDYAYVAPCGVFEVETFSSVSLPSDAVGVS